MDLTTAPEGASLVESAKRGFIYADARVDDARLVVLNALAAAELGAQILTRTECTSARRDHGVWRAELSDRRGGPSAELTARAVVHA